MAENDCCGSNEVKCCKSEQDCCSVSIQCKGGEPCSYDFDCARQEDGSCSCKTVVYCKNDKDGNCPCSVTHNCQIKCKGTVEFKCT